ncbi:site-specific DNA-methyltransferase (adenine-specific) [Chryseobacterium oranimense]|uniref:Site-specific DNA-methyltransferase (Adenine-specific) n=1 Tax=Chryseobacterium oranimense TaxID=421058 RepID=A0A1M5WRH4_9FLAO|nr:MT-A70 family methyltransferase [Chryseobacterium oranimense]SHH90167.1 site-specific DNA-methyltransferase (adenine-specific) [Chryseobacterium oranimense]
MKYKVIYADPPWIQKAGRKMSGYKIVDGKEIWNSEHSKPEDLPYDTMTVDEICKMPVKELICKDSVLFMWVTNKYLLQAEKVIKAWGFEYVACITWRKNRMGGGLGGVVRISSEYLLFCRRGNLKAVGNIPESVIDAKRPYVNGYPCHSKKPEVFREIIEQCFPYEEKLELFARHETKGWDVFGNEVENSIEINH